jgi:hypothetical protein
LGIYSPNLSLRELSRTFFTFADKAFQAPVHLNIKAISNRL